MANPNETKPISGLSREDLVALIDAVRKPIKSDKETREEEQAKLDREQMGKMLEQGRQNRLANQQACPHMRRDGSTTTVWTGDPINKLYCQACCAWIGPDEPALFNRLYDLAIA